MAPQAEIYLSLAGLRAISSPGRVDVLRSLGPRPMTVTELAEALRLPKSTVHAHLQVLAGSGLVLREDDDRVWVYYRLSETGRTLAESKRPHIILLWGALALACATVGAALAWRAMHAAEGASVAWVVSDPTAGGPRDGPAAGDPFLAAGMGLVALGLLLVISLAAWTLSKRKRADRQGP